MKKRITRKDFIKLTTLGGVGLYISSCQTNNKTTETENTTETKNKDTTNAINDSTAISSSENVTFHQKGEAAYESLRTGFNKRIQKFPRTIAQCKNTNGVSEAIKYAKQNKLVVSVKSGGHCFEGYSSNNEGLVVNLSGMNKIEWRDDYKVKVEPGCTLARLYDETLPKGKIVPAGSCGGVGVGGLALGGGYGFFSRKYGLTCDSLLEFTMVDGDGNIHNSKDNPDLLWACKGGGNGNFGIITEMIFKTYDAPAHFTSHRFKLHKVDVEKAQTILEKWFALTKSLPLSCFSAFVLNSKTIYILLTDYETNPSVVQQFKNELSPFVDTITLGKPKPLAESLKVFRGQSAPTFFKNSSAGLYTDYENILPFIKNILQKVIDTPRMIYQINTLGGNINQLSFKETSAYPHREYPYLSELQTYWESPSQTEKFVTAFEEVQSIFKNNGIQTQYRNYPDINFKDWQNAYYNENYSKLQDIKQQYDPDNIFRYEQSVELKKI